jgi:diguanylate cyclase (GGDEF)-like protein
MTQDSATHDSGAAVDHTMTEASNASSTSPQQVDRLNAEAYRLRHSDTLQALSLCQQAHTRALRLDYHQGICLSLLRWGVCSYILGHALTEVRARLHAALELAQALDDAQAQIEALNILAMLDADSGAHGMSMQAYDKCLALAKSIGDTRSEGRTLGNMALVHRDLGRYAQALDHLQRYLDLAERTGDEQGQTYALANMGQLLSTLGESEAARQALQRSLAIRYSQQDLARQSSTRLDLGKLLLKQGEISEARTHLLEAVQLSRRTGNLRDLCDALHGLARAYQYDKDHDAVRQLLNEAHELAARADDNQRLAAVQLAIGKHLIELGDLDAAQTCLQGVLQRAESLSLPELLADTHQALASIAEAGADYQVALQHFRSFHQVREAMHGEQAQQHLRGLLIRQQVQEIQRQADGERIRSQELSSELDAARQADQEKQLLVQQLSAQAEMLHQLSREDGLTGVANRRWLDLQLVQEFERARRFAHPLSVAMLDLDHFKSINDRFTHLTGDKVLRAIGTLLRDACRRADVVARYGGEEFMLVLVETPLNKAESLCEKLRQRIEQFDWATIHPELSGVTLSIGLESNAHFTQLEALIAAVDARLYEAKRQGRNRISAGSP